MTATVVYRHLSKQWRIELVLLSFIVSFLGAYTTTQLFIQTTGTRRAGRAMFWVFLAAVSFGGTGIWCMHFVGMLAVDVGVAMQFTAPLTIATAISAILGTFLTLLINIPPPERASKSSAAKIWHFCFDLLSSKRWRGLWHKRKFTIDLQRAHLLSLFRSNCSAI